MNASVISVYPTPTCWKVFVHCPYCRRRHSHGGGDGARPFFGSRMSHCGKGEYTITVDSNSNVAGLPSDDPLVSQLISNQSLGAGNGAE